ncbi:hypothetical protein PCASD_12399 [Puccinia coronata f. sp. avenae]|uniref:Uncharacterized protein n=1 Tax=Puccinia coronata f. sp. avenae TaxID=200324 RepID=A0A2N5U4Q8_9BASI|nr:hypothetical protein PCASD_12399 [Puccinia coronata f. sp. avenae]
MDAIKTKLLPVCPSAPLANQLDPSTQNAVDNLRVIGTTATTPHGINITSNQACRASDVRSNNPLSGSTHAPKGRMQCDGQRKPSIKCFTLMPAVFNLALCLPIALNPFIDVAKPPNAFNQGIVGNDNLRTPRPMEAWQTQKVTAVVTVFNFHQLPFQALPGAQGHRRSHSKASRTSSIDFGAEASTDLNQHQMQFQQLAQFRAALRHTRVPSFVFQNPMNLEPVRSNVGQGIQQMCTSVFAELSPRAAAAAPLLSWLMDPAPQDHLRHRHQTLALLNPANPNQVTLVVERECYVFELYLPASHPMGPSSIWYHLLSAFLALHFPRTQSDSQSFQSSTNGNLSCAPAHLPDGPQLFLAVFPASHPQMIEHLDDSSP